MELLSLLPITSSKIQILYLPLLYTFIATFIINLPFGYIRGGLRKLSFWWFVAIHAPVPLVILIRKFHHLDLTWELAPFLFGPFILGQFMGKKIYKLKPYRKQKNNQK